MPTNYTGDPTAVQSPDTGAAPGHAPVIALPVDGDALSAGTIYQLAKVPADYIALLYELMFPVLPLTGTYTRQARFRSPDGYARFAIDRLGFPTGRYSYLREDWNAALSSAVTSSGQITALPAWTASITGTVTGISTVTGSYRLYLRAGGVTNNVVTVQTSIASISGNDPFYRDSVIEWDCALDVLGSNGIKCVCGFYNGLNVGTATAGVYFKKASSDTNWQCVASSDGTGGNTTTISTTPGTPPIRSVDAAVQRFRIEFHRAGSAYGAVALFFIDNALVGTITTHLPDIASTILKPTFGIVADAMGTDYGLYLGPVIFAASRLAVDQTI